MRKVRYLSAGRLAFLEDYRSNIHGKNSNNVGKAAAFGQKQLSSFRHNSETAFGDFHTLNVRPDIQIKVTISHGL